MAVLSPSLCALGFLLLHYSVNGNSQLDPIDEDSTDGLIGWPTNSPIADAGKPNERHPEELEILTELDVELCQQRHSCAGRCGLYKDADGEVDCNCDIDCMSTGDCCLDVNELCWDPTSTGKNQVTPEKDMVLSMVSLLDEGLCPYCNATTKVVKLWNGEFDFYIEVLTQCPDRTATTSDCSNSTLLKLEMASVKGVNYMFNVLDCFICEGTMSHRLRWLPSSMCRNENANLAVVILATQGFEAFLDYSSRYCTQMYDVFNMPPPLIRFLTIPNFIKSCDPSLRTQIEGFEQIEKACMAFMAPIGLVVKHAGDGVLEEKTIFKNAFCAICNGHSMENRGIVANGERGQHGMANVDNMALGHTNNFTCDHRVLYTVPLPLGPVDEDMVFLSSILSHADSWVVLVGLDGNPVCPAGFLYDVLRKTCEKLHSSMPMGGASVGNPRPTITRPFRGRLNIAPTLLLFFTIEKGQDYFAHKLAMHEIRRSVIYSMGVSSLSVQLFCYSRQLRSRGYTQATLQLLGNGGPKQSEEDIRDKACVAEIVLSTNATILPYTQKMDTIMWYTASRLGTSKVSVSIKSALLLNTLPSDAFRSIYCAKTPQTTMTRLQGETPGYDPGTTENLPEPEADDIFIYDVTNNTLMPYVNDIVGLVHFKNLGDKLGEIVRCRTRPNTREARPVGSVSSIAWCSLPHPPILTLLLPLASSIIHFL